MKFDYRVQEEEEEAGRAEAGQPGTVKIQYDYGRYICLMQNHSF